MRVFCVLIGFSMGAAALFAEQPVRVEVSRDAWVSAYPSEVEGNNGGSHRLKLKGIQEFSLVDFDARELQGKHVERAELWVRVEGDAILDRVTVSTVMADWVEGQGNNYDKNSNGASFLWAEGKRKRWAGPTSDLTSVTLGNGGSQWCFGDCSPPDSNRWQRIPIDPAIVQSRIDNECFGFLLVDDLGSEYTRDGNDFKYHLMVNRFLASRDKNRSQSPYFRLWLSNRDSSLPAQKQISANTAGKQLAAKRQQIKETLASLQREQPPLGDELISPRLLNLDLQPLKSRDLCMARGETIAFVVDAAPEQVEFAAPDGFDVAIYALPAVQSKFDPAVPLPLWSDPKWIRGRNRAIKTCVDVYAEKTTTAGQHQLQLLVDNQPLKLQLSVWQFTLPDRLRFIPQMNCYSLPENEIPFFQLCHNHRTTLNRLRYGWSGKVNSDAIPTRQANGSWDWTKWDRRFGPLLDGSAFAKSKRGAIPIEAFYLPLNENWPMNHEKHFRGGYWIEDAYDDAYWEQFRDAARLFAQHLAESGYDETMFEFYLNNKVYFKQQRDGRWDACSAAWVFDEPVNTQDFWALRRFGVEFWQGVLGIEGPQLAMRVDISRPQWQRNLLDGVSSVEIVSGSLRSYGRRVINRAHRYDNLVYMYGSANKFDVPCSTNVAWCVETWGRGAVGVVPWQTIGNDKSWQQLDPLSVIYPSEFGPIPSLRLKSFRQGQQFVEYLECFRSVIGNVYAEQIGDVLLAKLRFDSQTIRLSEADAGSSRYDSKLSDRLGELRFQLGQWLSGQTISEVTDQMPMIRPRVGLSSDTPLITPVVLGPAN
ncbi:hypothetical protein CA13_49090 [Planctomycetes bacterium CA13]|uniref:Uncharacterized protein n=1 Tax=Novipirellula herctigrandis TaxID=2527986 RepID=A0A5C5Z807_9BACT|nr:hypothetical protein CA13_49090 [Planctomycetes bacterium CA13]